MGTVGYMAPEQVRGQAVDARADLFAFGAVLYEMLSGQPRVSARHAGRHDDGDPQARIRRSCPPSRADLSPALDRIVRHCLEKNPAERFQSARDVAFALEAFSGTSLDRGVARDSRRRRRLAAGVARWRWQSSQSRRLRPGVLADRRDRGRRQRQSRFETQDVGPAVDHQRALLAGRSDDRLQRRADRQHARLFVIRPGTVDAAAARRAGHASAFDLVEGRAGRAHRRPLRSAIGFSAARSRG